MASAAPSHQRLLHALLGAVVLLFLWACWASGQLLSDRERPVVAVDLGRIMSDFIRAESARDLSDREAAVRAAMFARVAEEGVNALAADGSLVLVSQAVVGRSARDATPELARYIDRRMVETPAVPALPNPSALPRLEPPAAPAGDRE
jgi:hypothetical protein